MSEAMFKKIGNLGIVPVVVMNDVENAVPLANALIKGGLPVAEVTLRTAAAEESIRRMANETDILVGAGTVLSTEQADKAIKAGAKFIVSPGLNPDVVKFCQDKGVAITPGTSNPTDIEAAMGLGLKVVKFFPAEPMGGVKTLKAIAGPYKMMKFLPTGGITTKTVADYLSLPCVLACGGSWMVKPATVDAKKFDEVEAITRESVQLMLGFDLAHLGINCADADSALECANTLGGLFDLEVKPGNSSNFVSTIFEIMKGNGSGDNGHIAIRTNNIWRAIAYLESKGIEVDMSTAKGDPMIAVYLKDQYYGFTIHLLQKK
ncbi:MAG: bifunctional 4-hydroxy-2-oxoglutarate aldolase/2-dehydro-3-deoxy-phosphogluconate aldolase [Abditibacteriota bacterium]|nr:bifunctional 4-hydroxy-2-oxoglutarate aldolase/2-dehydro-3-deoxy-phosphogluconate aldolase [Abditibacteriota bacterium]MBP5738058.1 bifunctional 4-hydroxy-2-oxoglutarate aldolase/2-dehydro-3-deoxy-phosphogluconate aldolase [Abditibacteriota bacterium]